MHRHLIVLAAALALAGPANATNGTTTYDWRDTANTALLEQAAPAVAAKRNVWAKTLALRDTVRQFHPVGSGTCYDYAREMVAVGQHLGLPVRLVAASLNGHNEYDTHTTVEVWLQTLRKWVLADPTMAAHFTVGNRPVGAFEIRAMLHAGTWRNVKAQTSRVASQRPESNYIDPRLYFRFVGVYGTVNARKAVLLPADSVSITSDVAVTTADLGRVPPGRSVTTVKPTREYTEARPAVVAPSWYAPEARPYVAGDSVAVLVDADGPVVVDGYATTWTRDGWLAPVHYAPSTIRVEGAYRSMRVLVVSRMR